MNKPRIKVDFNESKDYLGSSFIASRPLAKGMSNIFSVVGESLGVTIKVFDSIDSAIKSVKDNVINNTISN